MDYQKKYKTKSKAAIDKIKELEKENTRLAGRLATCNNGNIHIENEKLLYDNDALKEKNKVLEKQLADERLKNQALEMVGSDFNSAKNRIKELEKKLNVLEFSEVELNDHCHELEGECRGLREAIKLFTREKGE